MPLTTEDRLAIADQVALQGHLFDDGELDRLEELFTADDDDTASPAAVERTWVDVRGA